MVLVTCFSNLGIHTALIQKKEVDELDYCTFFWADTMVRLIVFGIVFIIAPFAATYYNKPELCALIRIISLGIPIGIIASVSGLKLTRAMDFKPPSVISMICCVISSIVALIMALRGLWPFSVVGSNFTACFLLFYLFIPFLNKLIHTLSEKEHRYLMLLSLGIYSCIASFPMMRVAMNYVSWFMVLYILASYLRLHGEKFVAQFSRFTPPIMLLSIAVACGSVLFGHWIHLHRGLDTVYYFVMDSNKALAVFVSVLAFLTFKNLSIPQTRLINTVASTTFGILCIHANSDAMRTFLWQDFCKNAQMYQTPPYFVLHAIGVVLAVFAVCSCIEMVRQRILEERLLNVVEALFRRSGA